MSRQRKRDAVLRLLRGEDLETVSRELGVTTATLSGWRDAFLAAGEASLATCPTEGEALGSERLEALLAFRATYNITPPIERHGFQTPDATRQQHLQVAALAA